VQFSFDYLGVDAITIQPYLGKEAVQPFLDRKDKGIIVLCKTSNPGSGEFQEERLNLSSEEGSTLSEYVAKQVVEVWNTKNNCLMVVGATYPEELKSIRQIAGDMTFLVPGIGAQGGDIEKTVTAGLNSKNAGMIINSSRGIIFAENPRSVAQSLRDEINKHRI
jgi:orotidine-5'-phosphate decarboxylase